MNSAAEWVLLVLVYSTLGVPALLLCGWALRERGKAFDAALNERRAELGRPLTLPERWELMD